VAIPVTRRWVWVARRAAPSLSIAETGPGPEIGISLARPAGSPPTARPTSCSRTRDRIANPRPGAWLCPSIAGSPWQFGRGTTAANTETRAPTRQKRRPPNTMSPFPRYPRRGNRRGESLDLNNIARSSDTDGSAAAPTARGQEDGWRRLALEGGGVDDVAPGVPRPWRLGAATLACSTSGNVFYRSTTRALTVGGGRWVEGDL